MKALLIILGVAVAIAAVVRFGDLPLGGEIQLGEALHSMLYGVIAVSLAASLMLRYRGKLSTALLAAIAWVLIFGVVIVGYTYRRDLGLVATRVMDEVVPGRTVVSEPGTAVVVRGGNGHFYMTGLTNGASLRYMFDTGASTVVLTAEDARRAGLDPDKLAYTAIVSTANRTASTTPVRIETLTVGGITMRNVRALVARPGVLRDNLLGMSFLSELTSFTVQGNRLVMQR